MRPATVADRDWITAEAAPIGGRRVVSQRRLHDLTAHDAVIAWADGSRVGFAAYALDPPRAELLGIRPSGKGRASAPP